MSNDRIEEAQQHDTRVRVTSIYTATAEDRHFVADAHFTVRQTVAEAYAKLGESPRPGDSYFCQGEPRVDLTPYLDQTLRQLEEGGICLLHNGRDELELIFDIDTEPGGASR